MSRKAAPSKAAPSRAAGPKTAPTREQPAALDDGWNEVETSAPRIPSEHRKKVEQHVLHLYQSTLDPAAALPTVLAVDPNDHDLDPSPFYEALEDAFKVEDPSKHEFAGYGGTIEHTINFIAGRWKGGELKQSGDDATFE